MTPGLASIKTVVVLTALAALSGCARSGPPAPVTLLGEPARTAASAPTPAPPSESPKSAPAKSQPIKNGPATMPPPALAPQEHLPHPDHVVVSKGETLYMIARRYDVPVRSIIDANHLDPPFQIAAGTSLAVPQERFHTVQAGDTLYGISRLYGVEVSTLASINHRTAPFAIRAGETLYLPAPVAPPERVATSPAPRPETAPEPQTPLESPPATKPAPDRSIAAAPPASKPHASRVFAWPLEGRVIASYGTAANGTHNDGINIAARAGEPVRAADSGRVAYAGNELRGYGNLVLIKHPGGYMTAYAHNGKLLVKRGEAVRRGQEIAKAGATGTVSAPQLHFEIRQGTRALDPTNYLPLVKASAN